MLRTFVMAIVLILGFFSLPLIYLLVVLTKQLWWFLLWPIMLAIMLTAAASIRQH